MDRLLTDSEIREALQQETGFIQARDYRYEKVIKTAQDAKTLKAVGEYYLDKINRMTNRPFTHFTQIYRDEIETLLKGKIPKKG